MNTTLAFDRSPVAHISMNCSACAHWMHQRTVNAWASGRVLAMAQCLNDYDDNAPTAAVQGPFGSAVLTHAESCCPAFLMRPESEGGEA